MQLEHFHKWNGSTRMHQTSELPLMAIGLLNVFVFLVPVTVNFILQIWNHETAFSLLLTHLFLPSVSSRSTLETTPELKSLSTAACDESKTISIYFRFPTSSNINTVTSCVILCHHMCLQVMSSFTQKSSYYCLQCWQDIDSFILIDSPVQTHETWQLEHLRPNIMTMKLHTKLMDAHGNFREGIRPWKSQLRCLHNEATLLPCLAILSANTSRSAQLKQDKK